METTVIAPDSFSSPSTNRASASTTAQDDGPVNPLCEAHSNECRTGCFVMRKVIAHIFGRNKACTSQIPEHCWVEWCRKHYQRLRHRMLEQGWIFLQINCLRTQLGRMEEWGEVQSFTIVLQRRFQEELDREDPSQNPEDEAGLRNLPDATTKSKAYHATGHTKASPNCFLYPFLGAKKSFHDVYAVIDVVEKAANEGHLTFLPPLQFLPLIDTTLHPPPPIARPRKKRKPKVYKKQAHDDDDSDLETLVDDDNPRSNDNSTSRHSSPAKQSSSILAKKQGVVEPSSLPLATTSTPVATSPEYKIQYVVNYDNDNEVALGIVPDFTDSKVASENPSLVAQPSSSLNFTKHQVAVETDSLPTSTAEKRVDETFEMQVSIVDKGSAGLTERFVAINKESEVSTNKFRVAQISSLATKKRSGATSSMSSHVEKTHNSRETQAPVALPQKIQAPPPGSIPVIDKEYGFVGYKTPRLKSDKTASSSARRLRNKRHHAAAVESEEPLSKSIPLQFNSYPIDATRTYKCALNKTNDYILAPATDECKDSAMETHRNRRSPLEKHPVENEYQDADTPMLHNGDPIASTEQTRFNGWTPVNAPTVTAPYAMSVSKILNADNNTIAQRDSSPDSESGTTSLNPERFASTPSPSTHGDGTGSSSFGIPVGSVARVSERLSRKRPSPASKKRSGFDSEKESPAGGQPLGKRRM